MSSSRSAKVEFNLHDLEESSRDYAFELDTEWITQHFAEDNLRSTGEFVHTNFHAVLTAGEVFVRGTVSADLLAECSRCLNDAPLKLRSDFNLLFSKRAKIQEVEEIDADAAVEMEPLSGDVVKLDSYLREYLLLEVPMQTLCRQDCPGIPIPEHVRGVDEVAEIRDPRLAPLFKLAEQAAEADKAKKN